MNATIRETRIDDLPALVPTHMAAFAGTLGVELGERYVTEFLRWFITDSEAINLVCEKDGQIAGYVFGAPTGYNTRMNRALMGTIALATITHPQVLARSGFFRQIPERVMALLGKAKKLPAPATASASLPSDEHSYRLTGIGVSPQFRRQGIAQQLIAGYEQQVWAKGCDVIYLSVYADNAGARALYEGCGWRAVNDGTVVTYKRVNPSS
jgi:ribosomal protein S18 acetylase RimI-like enzyme